MTGDVVVGVLLLTTAPERAFIPKINLLFAIIIIDYMYIDTE